MKKIAIIELDVPNHYQCINSIVKIYLSSEKEYIIDIYTIPEIKKLLEPIILPNEKVKIFTFEKEKTPDCLHAVINGSYDRIHIASLYNNIKIYCRTSLNAPVYLGIHNEAPLWFYKNIFELLKISIKYLYLKFDKDFIYKLRVLFSENISDIYYRKKFISQVLMLNGKIVVYGPNVRKFIANYVHKKNIIQIPFALFENTEQSDVSKPNYTNKLRVCIPGKVNEQIKDYELLFDALQKKENLKNKIELILLGKLELPEQRIQEMDNLIKLGYSITFYTSYISEEEFSKTISTSDIIIGNINIQKVPYGVSAETGILYNMIRYGKPGLLPKGFNNFNELESSTIYFNNYEELTETLYQFYDNQDILKDLQHKAVQNALAFAPMQYAQALI